MSGKEYKIENFQNFKIFTKKHPVFKPQLDIKNCKITGNFGELEILTDANVPADFVTLAQKQSTTTENTVSGLDYTAFMINKENQSEFNLSSKP